jgi:hypothetical protein
MMKPHRRQRPAVVDYAVILGAWLLMFAYMTSGGGPYPPPSLYQDYHAPIHTHNAVLK